MDYCAHAHTQARVHFCMKWIQSGGQKQQQKTTTPLKHLPQYNPVVVVVFLLVQKRKMH